MTIEKINADSKFHVQITRGGSAKESVDLHGTYTAICYDKNGNKKWEDEFPNTVTTVGKNAILNNQFAANTVSAVTTTFYMGLIASNGYSAIAAADTMSSHAGWLESGAQGASAPGYSQTTRRALTFAAAASSSKATSNGAIFSMNVAGTVKGAFIVNHSTKGPSGTAGTLYSAGLFTVGDKVVTSGDSLTVTYTASA